MIKKSYEDYLRAIYELYEQQLDKKEGIKKTDVANSLKISKSGVTQMMGKFSRDGLVEMDLYSRIFFTRKGLIMAEKITRKHRIIEVFLRDCLNLESLDRINQEAHKLEHSFSDDVINRLAKFLGNPKECPHGEKIKK